MSPQQRKLLSALQVAGKHGIHSHHCRTQLHLGDPSRRIGDLRERGYDIRQRTERRNGAHGVRWFLFPKAESGEVASLPVGPSALEPRRESHLSLVGAGASSHPGAPARLVEVVLDCTGPEAREYVRPRESWDDWECLSELDDGLSLWKPKAAESKAAA